MKKKTNIEGLLQKLFGDKKNRRIYTLIAILPFIIVIGVCGFMLYKEAKNIIGMAGDTGTAAVSDNYSINNGSFVLRDTATDIQKEYFKELKAMYEDTSSTATDTDIVACTVKNFVADFYTFSNKLGQYDVGGMYYVFTPQRQTIYIQARDQFYQYLSTYIDKYGTENLLEVESVEIISTKELTEAYTATLTNEETNEEYSSDLTMYGVSATWTYVAKDGGFSTSSYDTKANFMVVNNNGRFEIAYMGSEAYTNE